MSVDLEKIAVALARSSETHPSFAYPWDGLEDWMASQSLDRLALVGYGSLINTVSAGRTINVDSAASRSAVLAFGAKRVFNYRMPREMLIRRYGSDPGEVEVAALNCELSGSAEDQFNGILTHVEIDRLGPLRERERHYALKPVVYVPWNDREAELQVAYIFELLPDSSIENHPYDASILPHKGYVQLCQDGAAAISDAFLSFFNATCLLADKKTTLAER